MKTIKLHKLMTKTALLAIMIAGMLFCFGGIIKTYAADEPELSARIRDWNRDKVWADPDQAASGQVTEYGGSMVGRLYPSVELTYANLEPETEYTCYMMLTHLDNNRDYGGKETFWSEMSGTFTTDSTGSGVAVMDMKFEDYIWFDMTGKWEARLKVYPTADNNNAIDIVAPDGDESLTINYRGITSMEIDADTMVKSGMERFMSVDNAKTDDTLHGAITFRGLTPNTTYTGTARLRGIPRTGWMVFQNFGDEISVEATSDAEGNMTLVIPHNVKGIDLDTSLHYFSSFNIQSTTNSSDNYWYGTAQYIWAGYDSIDGMLPGQAVMYVLEDEKPDEEKTTAKVNVTNLSGIDSKPLTGAEFKIVKGNKPDGELVESWVQKDEEYETTLELGEYTLVQTKAPSGYKGTEPLVFSVTADDAEKRNYAFEGYATNKAAEDGSNVRHLAIRKDRSDDEGEVVFCLNAGKYFGGRADRENNKVLYYTEYGIEEAKLNDIIANPRLEIDELRDKLKQIVYAGYPNDKGGIRSKYGLTDSELQAITQMAVHYYTDSMEFNRLAYYVWPYFHEDASDEVDLTSSYIYRAWSELINTDIEFPKDMTVKFYLPENESFQTVISTYIRMKTPNVAIVVYNEKDEPSEEVKSAKDSSGSEGSPGSETSKKARGADTGDDSSLKLWIICMFAGALGFATLAIRRT